MNIEDEKCLRCYAKSECEREDLRRAAKANVLATKVSSSDDFRRVAPEAPQCEGIRKHVRERRKGQKAVQPFLPMELPPKTSERAP